MKLAGQNLTRRLRLYVERVCRARCRRGHGVHSPFVYGFVRKVLMCRTLFEGTGAQLYDALRREGVAEACARQLHNTLYYIEGKSYAINDVGCDLSILLGDYPIEKFSAAYQDAKIEGVTLAICNPYASRERQNVVQALIEAHTSTSVNNYAYVLFFFDEKLPKQHYRL